MRYLLIGLLALLGTCVLSAQQQTSVPAHADQTTRGWEPPDKLLATPVPQTAAQGAMERISFHDKFGLYWHQAVNPAGFALPAITAGYRMANPLQGYPHKWNAGAGAFARLYGDGLARRQSQEAAIFLVAAAVHEDPRYWPSEKPGVARRITHALAFTVVDKSDSGRNMPALSNFAGAGASGFVGAAYLPRGFDDFIHVGQRSAVSFGLLGAWNVVNEFCPEWRPAMVKLHVSWLHGPCGKSH